MSIKVRLLQEESELALGIKTEREHLPTIKLMKDYYDKNNKWPEDKQICEWIAKDHLKEDGKYYSKIKKMGL